MTACSKNSPDTNSSINNITDFQLSSSDEKENEEELLSSTESTQSTQSNSSVISSTTSKEESSTQSSNPVIEQNTTTTTPPKTPQTSSQNTTPSVVKNKVDLYSQVGGKNVVQASFEYNEGETWADILERNFSITEDTTFDVNFNEIEYLKYNGKAILRYDRPVQTDDVVSAEPVYRLGIIAGPAKIQPTTMYDLINVENAFDNGPGGKEWSVRRYVITETSKTTGTITMDYIKVIEYSKPDESFNGTIITSNSKPTVYTYTSDYGLYAGKTINVSDGSTILLGNDLYWFRKEGYNKRVLCSDYKAYKNVPNSPTDKYWDCYWSQF